MISYVSIAVMAFDLLLGIALPTALAIILRKKFKLGLKPFFVGCAVWIIFVMVLEKILHTVILKSPFGAVIQGNVWYYALYGGLAAGLFEEGGRYLAMKTVLRKEHGDKRNSILYGAGHGGIEAFVILSLGMVNNLTYSILYNTGNISLVTAFLDEGQRSTFQMVLDQLAAASPATFLAGPAERITAIIFHIALSVIVWMGVTGKRALMLPLAIFLHFTVDAVSVILSRQGIGIALTEVIIFAMVVPVAWYAYRLFTKIYRELNF